MGPHEHVDVLIVDDNDAVLRSTTEILQSAGLSVVQAENGLQALEVFAEVTPTLVLLDLSMPILDGPSFMESLERDTRIVIMSSHPPAKFSLDPLDLRVLDYLVKPVDPSMLINAVMPICRPEGVAKDEP